MKFGISFRNKFSRWLATHGPSFGHQKINNKLFLNLPYKTKTISLFTNYKKKV